MHRINGLSGVLVACGALLTSCAATEKGESSERTGDSTPEVQANPPGQVASANPNAAGLQSAMDAAFEDAVKQTGLERTKLELVSAEVVTWRDGALGCPAPGGMYTQALVPGYRIRIKAGTRELDYHASTRGGLMLCPAGRAADPIQGEAM